LKLYSERHIFFKLSIENVGVYGRWYCEIVWKNDNVKNYMIKEEGCNE